MDPVVFCYPLLTCSITTIALMLIGESHRRPWHVKIKSASCSTDFRCVQPNQFRKDHKFTTIMVWETDPYNIFTTNLVTLIYFIQGKRSAAQWCVRFGFIKSQAVGNSVSLHLPKIVKNKKIAELLSPTKASLLHGNISRAYKLANRLADMKLGKTFGIETNFSACVN